MNHCKLQLAIERRASAVLRGRVEAERARAAELEEGLRRLVSELESGTGPSAAMVQVCPKTPHTHSQTQTTESSGELINILYR